jgi:hypothetical protein
VQVAGHAEAFDLLLVDDAAQQLPDVPLARAAVFDLFEQLPGHLLKLRRALPDAALQKVAVTALAVFNDCISRAAFAAAVPLLDLRLICIEPEDYANPSSLRRAAGRRSPERS